MTYQIDIIGNKHRIKKRLVRDANGLLINRNRNRRIKLNDDKIVEAEI